MNDKIIDTENEKEVKKKFFTKDRLCWLAVGLIIGAAIASAAFLIYINVSGNQSGMGPGGLPEMSEHGLRPEKPSGTPPEMGDGETPPELPDGETPPEMPAGETPESDTSSGTNENSSDSSTESNTSSKKSKTESAE